MAARRILITGAAGFIGSALAQRLLAEGREVVAFDRRPTAIAARDRLTVVAGDVLDVGALSAAAAGCDTLVHLAAIVQTHGPRSAFERVNVGGTRSAGEAARAAGVGRLLFMSSVAVLDYARGYLEADESSPCGGHLSEYGRSKLLGESIVQQLHAGSLTTTIVRPGLLPLGRGDRAGTWSLLRAVEQRQALLVGGGTARLSTSYLENLLDGLQLCMDSPAAAGELFQLTDEGAPTWRDLLIELAAALGVAPNLSSTPRWLATLAGPLVELGWRATRRQGPPPVSRYAVSMVSRDLHFSHRKATRLLGYTPRIGRSAGLAACVDWYTQERAATLALPASLRSY